MCSLHVLPTIGSNVTVHITSVNLHSHSAFVEFGGNFNHGQLTREIYQQMKKDIHTHNKRDCNFEGNPGALCLVKEEKNCHRARILSRCGDKYNVFLIDDGRTMWASNSIMSWGHTSYFKLPPMMELFILASASPLPSENRWSPTAYKFLKSLTGKTVCGCVQDVMMPSRIILLDLPSVFKQMHEFGFARKIPCGQFQILVEDSLHSPRDDVSRPGSPLTNVQIVHASSTESIQQFLCPELMPGTIETVEVTHVVNPLSVFCKLQVFSFELKRLSKQIQEYCESTSSSLMPKPLSDGCPCATKGSDGMWYRSIQQQHVVSDVAKVFHVDYGREDFVKLGDVRPLSAKFFRLPVVTYACSLHGVKDKGTGWKTEQISWLKSVLLNQIFVGKFEHRSLSDGIYHVTLYGNNSVNINDSFAVHDKCSIMSERASFCSKQTPRGCLEHTTVTPVHSLDSCTLAKVSGFAWTEMSTTEDSPEDLKSTYKGLHNDLPNQCEGHSVLTEHLFTIGTVVEVIVSYVESDQTFWCQMADSIANLKMLMEDLQRHYSCSQFQIPIGSVCVACHPNNGMWYRVHILNRSLNSSQIDVRLIDYGQRLKVPLQDLRPIDSEFLKLKRQAFQCSLFNKVNSVSSEGTALSDSAFSDSLDLISSASLDNATLKFTICAVMYDPQGTMLNMVDIESLSPNRRTALIQKEADSSAVDSLDTHCVLNSADSTPNTNLPTKEKVWITCVKGVDHFYGQFQRNAAMVEKLTKDIQQFCGMAHPKGNQFSPQMMCLARYKDGQWYRGQIRSVNPKIIVHFVDYGDLLILDESDLLPFPGQPSFNMSIPFQAVQFSLFNDSLEESTTELNAWFESYATDRVFTATIMAKSPNGELLVEIHDGKTNINVKAKEKWNEIHNNKHNTKKQDINQRSHGLVKRLGRRDYSNSRLQADQGYRNSQKSADNPNFAGRNVGNVQCTGFAVCASRPFVSQSIKKKMDHEKHVASYSKLEDLPSRIMKAGFVSEGYVSHCNSPSSFFVQLACEETDICSLVDKLNCSQLCESQVEFSQLLPGHLVKAQYPCDGSWYRAVVKNKLDNCTIHVEYIDHGNEAILSVLKVRKLDMNFLKFPRYSIHCCVNVGDAERKKEWTEEQVDIFKNVISANGERKLLCNFIEEKESVWQVSIQDQSLLNLESTLELKSCNTSTTVCSREVCPGVYKKPDVSLGQKIEAYASSIVDPNFFWCQFADSENLDKISSIAQETGNSAQTNQILLYHLSKGDSCLALFPDDNLWYRAQVINKSVSSVSVLFVDYGNESKIDQTSVRSVPASLLEAPPQAFLCQLEGYKPMDGCWNEAASARFTELVVDKLLNVIIQDVKMASDLPICQYQYSVQVECNKVCISDLMKDYWNDFTAKVYGEMTEEVFLKPTTVTDVLSPTSVNKTCFPKVTDLPSTAFEQDSISEVYISHIISPYSFFVQLAKYENGLVSLTEELNSISTSVQMNSFPHGSLVKAVFPDDNSWYRAVIKGTNGKDIHVEFIDFGNEATVPATNVCKLEEHFLQVPRFSIHCSLKIDCHTGMPTEKGTCPLAGVFEKAGEKRLFCKFIQENKTVWEVNVADERNTLDGLPLEIWDDFDTLQNDSPEQDMAFKKPEISVGQTVEAYASSLVGPNYFWCQCANSEELDIISLIAQKSGDSAETACIQIDQLCKGDPCLALFTDKLWYRAKVIKKSPKSVSVLFVDYGNESEIESGSVKPLPLSLLERPLQAFLCQLEGFSPSDGSWANNATDKFWELVVDKPLTLTVTNIQNDLDSPSPSYCVMAQSQECVVNEQMKSFWTTSVCPNDESPKLPLSSIDTVPFVCNAQSVPEKRLHDIPNKSQENIRTSDFKPQSSSQENLREIVDIREECEETEVKQRPLITRDVIVLSSDESRLALEKCVSESMDEFRRIDVNCSSKSSQNCQLDNLLPCVGLSESASSYGSDQALVNQEAHLGNHQQAHLGCKAELDEAFQKRDS